VQKERDDSSEGNFGDLLIGDGPSKDFYVAEFCMRSSYFASLIRQNPRDGSETISNEEFSKRPTTI
jgi:hypothetical protein